MLIESKIQHILGYDARPLTSFAPLPVIAGAGGRRRCTCGRCPRWPRRTCRPPWRGRWRSTSRGSSGPGRRRGRPMLTPTLTQPPGRRESSPNPTPHRLGRIRSRHGITEAIRSNSVSLLINQCTQSQVRSRECVVRLCVSPRAAAPYPAPKTRAGPH